MRLSFQTRKNIVLSAKSREMCVLVSCNMPDWNCKLHGSRGRSVLHLLSKRHPSKMFCDWAENGGGHEQQGAD
jgi:hypothetical protein